MARSQAWFAVFAILGVVVAQRAVAAILLSLEGSGPVPEAGMSLFLVMVGLLTLAIQTLFMVALPVLAAVAVGSVFSRRQAGLVFRALAVALAFMVASVGMKLLLSAHAGNLGPAVPFMVFDIVVGFALGVVATSPWFGGFASRRFDSVRNVRASVPPGAATDGPRHATWQGYTVVSIASAMAVGAVFALYVATVVTPIDPEGVFAISWLVAIAAAATLLVSALATLTAVAFAQLSRRASTTRVRALIIVGGFTLSVSLVTVPVLVELRWPPAGIAGFVAIIVLIALAFAGGALAPWRYGFASTRVDRLLDQKIETSSPKQA